MRLTSYTDYALRVLIHLGVHSGRLVPRDEIATGFGISIHHLGKVVNQLVHEGYIESRRGPGGGIVLAKQPSEISIGQVVDAFEPDFDIVECFDEASNTCPIAPVCGLGPILKEAELAFHEVLMKYTLADILSSRNKGRYRQLLGGDGSQ